MGITVASGGTELPDGGELAGVTVASGGRGLPDDAELAGGGGVGVTAGGVIVAVGAWFVGGWFVGGACGVAETVPDFADSLPALSTAVTA